MLLLAVILCLSSVVTVKTARQVFQQHHIDMIGLGKGPLTDYLVMPTEKFICKIYGVPEFDTCSKARVKLFCIGRAHETLPPTSDTTKFHIMRAHYQASVWNQAHFPCPELLPVTEMGWMHLDGKLVPRRLSLPPIPKSCSCTNGSLTQCCSCRKICMECIEMCACNRRADVCRNIHDDMNDLEDRDWILTCRLINLKMQALTFERPVIKFGCMLILDVKCNVSYHETCITICIQIYVYISSYMIWRSLHEYVYVM